MTRPANSNDPLDFVRNLWSNMGFSLPGMVTPTFDVDELEKRIHDLKSVEGWLRMNLSMLQMTIQSLEMQLSTIGAVRAMGKFASASVQETAQASQAMAMPPPTEAQRDDAAPSPEGGEAPDEKTDSTATPEIPPAFAQAAMWPWNLMQQMHAQMQEAQLQARQQEEHRKQDAPKSSASRTKPPKAEKGTADATEPAKTDTRRGKRKTPEA